ncbi:hypothetical protein [uncultured Paracoccus sp.]|uniref:hypothetical protein n=1 Tax=uncultured Paracoccus sp. TaxID=189685 RepID=UPI00262CF71C|nr:hypothetical protein [uncultured Paracoccus sp.]
MVVLENKSRVPDIYFAYSQDFDYRKYLEEKSHFDEVVLAVDRSTSEIVGSADRLTERIGVGVEVLSGSIDRVGDAVSKGFNQVGEKLDRIDNTLQSGFQTISFDLNSIDKSINELSYICDLGFEKLAAHTIRSNELLEELVTLFKTPDQVWAREQFEYAKECVARELWDDALKYSNKSIHGDERNSGFHIEPAFHFLKGKILIQYPEAGEGDEFIRLALASFLDAVKYCGKEHQKLEALSLLQVSWCHYCLGSFENALEAIKKSIARDGSNPLAHFLKAKYEARTGDAAASGTSLGYAILADEILHIRALNDQDFLQSSLDLEKTARLARDYRREQFMEFCREIRLDQLIELQDLGKGINLGSEEIQSIINRLEDIRKDQTLITLNNFFLRNSQRFPCEAMEIEDRGKRAREELINKINSHISRLKSDSHREVVAEKKSKSSGSYDGMMGWGILAAAIILFFVFSSWWPQAPTLLIIIAAVVAAFFTYPVTTVGAMIISWLRAESEAQSEFAQAKANAERVNREGNERVKRSHAEGREIESRLKAVIGM